MDRFGRIGHTHTHMHIHTQKVLCIDTCMCCTHSFSHCNVALVEINLHERYTLPQPDTQIASFYLSNTKELLWVRERRKETDREGGKTQDGKKMEEREE